MFGNPAKLGRGGGGGGRGGSKRMIHHPLPPPHRPSAAGGRLPLGGAVVPRNRPGALPAPDETFSLVSSGPLSFGMIIRVTADLVDEIRRIESQGGTAKIKFGSVPNATSGNVIDVGGKDFTFTWSSELGDCDIYEERRGGEDGNGLLVESGSAWRKLNVQRILDESTKNHVKMRTEEAERQLKSRKAIVLDPANPSVKSQAKTMVASNIESNSRRMHWKQKKELAFKKRKLEPSQVSFSGPPKSIFKSGHSSVAGKDGPSVSPIKSPPEQSAAAASPLDTGNFSRSQPNADEIILPQVTSKEDVSISEKKVPNKTVNTAAREASGDKSNSRAAPADLRGTLISLLLENPKGMSLKSLEKAVGDTNPNAGRKIESMIKTIATYQAPGRYLLKPGVEMESFKKPLSDCGSSPECIGNQTPIAESAFTKKMVVEEFEPQSQSGSGLREESNVLEKIDVEHNSPLQLDSDRKVGDNSEERAGSSSESGTNSDSDSDSSDSGSDSGSQSRSRSRSKSRSPAGSGSVSSSDSDSDGSSSSKEGSEVDVDNLTSDDEKVESSRKIEDSYMKPCVSTGIWSGYEDGNERNDIDEKKLDGSSSALDLDREKCDDAEDAVNITDESPRDNNNKICENGVDVTDNADLVPRETKSLEEPLSTGGYKHSDRRLVSDVGSFLDDSKDQTTKPSVAERHTLMKDSTAPNQFDSSHKNSKAKSKSAFDVQLSSHDKLETAKRSKTGNAVPDSYKYHTSPMNDKANRDGNLMSGRPMVGESVPRAQFDTHQSGQRISDINSRAKAPDIMERPGKSVENLGRGTKQSERISSVPNESDGSAWKSSHQKFQVHKDRLQKEMQDEIGDAFEKPFPRNFREIGLGDKPSISSEGQFRKSGEQSGKTKDVGQITLLSYRSVPEDNNKTEVDKGSMLRRELSDLELGEFREPVPEETQAIRWPFERKNSFKSLENKSKSADNANFDLGKGLSAGKPVQESKKISPPNLRLGGQSNQGSFSRKISEDDQGDPVKTQQKVLPLHAQQFPMADRVDAETGPQLDKMADVAGKSRKNEARENQGNTLKILNKIQQTELKQSGQLLNSSTVKESKSHKANAVESDERRKEAVLSDNNANGRNGRKRRESSSDEDILLHSKYEKNKEFKGPIKDTAQYNEFIQEYNKKYHRYCSLMKNLQSTSDEFGKMGHDLHHVKDEDKDEYSKILGKISKTYSVCGEKHKKFKQIFSALHEELLHIKQCLKDYYYSTIHD